MQLVRRLFATFAQSYEDALKVALALERAGAAKTWIVEIGS